MSGQIRITPDVMRQRASEYRNEANEVNGVILRMDGLLSNLQSEWEGQSSQSYATRYEELKPSFQKAEELISEIATSLDSVATQIEETDSSIAGAFRG